MDSTPDRFVLPTYLRQFSNLVMWGTTLRRCRLLQNGGFGQFEGWVGLYAGGTLPFKPKIQSLGVIIVSTACKPHAVKSKGAPVVQIDELHAGGSLCPYEHLYGTRGRSLSSFVAISMESTTRENPRTKRGYWFKIRLRAIRFLRCARRVRSLLAFF